MQCRIILLSLSTRPHRAGSLARAASEGAIQFHLAGCTPPALRCLAPRHSLSQGRRADARSARHVACAQPLLTRPRGAACGDRSAARACMLLASMRARVDARESARSHCIEQRLIKMLTPDMALRRARRTGPARKSERVGPGCSAAAQSPTSPPIYGLCRKGCARAVEHVSRSAGSARSKPRTRSTARRTAGSALGVPEQ